MIFEIICGFKKSDPQHMRRFFYKADYVSFKEYLKNVDWSEIEGLDTLQNSS